MLELMCNIRRDLNGVNMVSSGKVYSIDLHFGSMHMIHYSVIRCCFFQWKTSHHTK